MADDIKKLQGSPFQNVSSWVFEKDIKRKKDPGKPLLGSNIREDTEAELDNNNLQVVLIGLVSRINEIIEEVKKVYE